MRINSSHARGKEKYIGLFVALITVPVTIGIAFRAS